MYRAAIVGLGRIASLLEDDPLREKPATHAGAIHANPACEIAGGFDTSAERREAFAQRWNAPGYSTVESLLEETKPQIVVVATHPDSHEKYVACAVDRSIPVVICEKPLAHSYRSARRIVAREKQGRTRIVVNHERRFSRDYLLAAEAVETGEFGNLLSVHGRLFFGRTARRDRVFLHDGTHLLDAIAYLCADTVELKKRYGAIKTNRGSTFFIGRLAKRGVPVTIEHGSERDYLVFEIVLSFESGEICVGNGEFTWRRSKESPYYSAYRSLSDSIRRRPEPSGYFSGVVAEAIALLQNPHRESRSSAADALGAMRVIARARRWTW